MAGPASGIGSNRLPAAHYRYVVTAQADPQTVLRVVGLFSQRGLIPLEVRGDRSDTGLSIVIAVELDDPAVAELLLQKLRALVLVDDVHLTERAA